MFESRKSKKSFIQFEKDASYTFLETGDIYEFKKSHFMVNQIQTGLTEEAINNIYLRIHTPGEPVRIYPLAGSASDSKISYNENMLRFQVLVEDIFCQVDFIPAALDGNSMEQESIWFWKVTLTGHGKTCDLVYIQDMGVADVGALRSNILYQSQYLGHHVDEGQYGYRIASRQNMDQGGSYPMLQQGALGTKIVAYATDAFQIFGRDSKKNRCPYALYEESLPSEVYQYELACIALQTERFELNGWKQVTFYGYFLTDCIDPDNQEAREARAQEVLSLLPDHEETMISVHKLARNEEFDTPYSSPVFSRDQMERFFPERRLEEKDGARLLSFFCGEHRHVVLQEKEAAMERTHGHILVTLPDDKKVDKELLTVTNYMYGVFASQLVVGNVDSNPLLDATRDILNLHTQHGLRVFIRLDGKYRLLTMPAAYEMGLNFSRWYYCLPDDVLIISSFVAADENVFTMQIKSESGKTYDCMISMSLALSGDNTHGELLVSEEESGLRLRPGKQNPSNQYYPELEYTISFTEGNGSFCTDGIFYHDGVDRDVSLLAATARGAQITMLVKGVLGEKPIAVGEKYQLAEEEKKFLDYYKKFLGNMVLDISADKPFEEDVQRMNELLLWFLHDAIIHFAVPHGLEQSGGAAWGTRDVCQGPMELFLTTGHFELARNTILEIFAHQNKCSGEWPQFFMFDRYPYAAGDCHGDVVFWPLKSIGDYLEATKDYELLTCQVPYRETASECESILGHIMRAVSNIEGRMLQGTYLVNYAGGDWDDTLQPAKPEWKEKLCSAWTDALAYQVIENLGKQLRAAAEDEGKSLMDLAGHMKEDFCRYLVKDGVIAGFILMDSLEEIHYLLHPLDDVTGITLRLLPLTRSIIAGIADPDLAKQNLQLIREQLDFPDGVRLMNRPTKYSGGKSVFFKRAEQAACVGREISLLYVHAHIRYLEALARLGEGESLWEGLLKVNPILVQRSVPNAMLRQSNAYFSSSDPDFKDRYEFSERFDELRRGEVAVKGGWKVYSSGPGIYLSRLIRDTLGIKMDKDGVTINPVLPKQQNELKLRITLWDTTHTICYQPGEKGYGVKSVSVDGKAVAAEEVPELYRRGGIRLTKEQWAEAPEGELLIQSF